MIRSKANCIVKGARTSYVLCKGLVGSCREASNPEASIAPPEGDSQPLEEVAGGLGRWL